LLKCNIIILTLWFCKVVDFSTDDKQARDEQHNQITYSEVWQNAYE